MKDREFGMEMMMFSVGVGFGAVWAGIVASAVGMVAALLAVVFLVRGYGADQEQGKQ
jgi:hypothetical protein